MFPPVVDLAITLLLSLVPTVLFLGLCRGLEKLRDDDLVNEVLADTGPDATDPSGQSWPPELADEHLPTAHGRAVDVPTGNCQHCGQANPEHVTFCGECLNRV